MQRIFFSCMALAALIGCSSATTEVPTNDSQSANSPSTESHPTESHPTGSSQSISELEALLCTGELPDNALLVDDYYQLTVCDWPIRMSAGLYGDDKANSVFDALKVDLGVVQSRLPERVVGDLRSVKIWLELDIPGTPGGVYHPSQQWLEDNGYPIKWAKSIQIGNAENYLNWRQQQPAIVLHELAHAYDDQYFNHAQPDLLAAYDSAKRSGIYEKVAYIEADRGLVEAYALDNAKEYFSELTEAYFWTNDYFPFNRAQLKGYDVAGYNAVKLMWEQQ